MSLPIPPRWSNAVRECSRSVTRASAQQMRRTPQQCAFSTTSPVSEEPGAERRDRPRWQQTPKAMAMPIRVRDPPRQAPYIVNTDSKVLDQAYNKMLGRGGDSMLPEEIKWLAVTHKSFDHGRRGFNDKLAFLGKRIVDLQCSLALLNAPQVVARHAEATSHPALQGLESLSSFSKQRTLDKHRLARLAQDYGLSSVVRWKPKKPDNLQGSGVEVVLAHTLYSIVGALALQKGGDAANQVVQERILGPLGLK